MTKYAKLAWVSLYKYWSINYLTFPPSVSLPLHSLTPCLSSLSRHHLPSLREAEIRGLSITECSSMHTQIKVSLLLAFSGMSVEPCWEISGTDPRDDGACLVRQTTKASKPPSLSFPHFFLSLWSTGQWGTFSEANNENLNTSPSFFSFPPPLLSLSLSLSLCPPCQSSLAGTHPRDNRAHLASGNFPTHNESCGDGLLWTFWHERSNHLTIQVSPAWFQHA